jgi:hypothetical protein
MPSLIDIFAQAVLTQPPVILGRQLRPLCAGHLIILEALESPFVRGGSATPGDLVRAVWVCSKTFEEGKAALWSDDAAAECRKWGRAHRRDSYLDALAAFYEYWGAYHESPPLFVAETAKTANVPLPFVIVVRLRTDMRVSDKEAWNMPICLALCYLSTISELSGDPNVKIQADDDHPIILKKPDAA